MISPTTPLEPLEVVERGSSTSLIDLPPELLIAICAFVAFPTAVWCRLVCRRLRDIIDASLEMEYRIELARDGMIDGGACSYTHWHSQTLDSAFTRTRTRTRAQTQTETEETIARAPLTTSDRLARLRELRKAWSTLSWTRCVTVPMPGPCCAYELVGGVFCKTRPTAGEGINVLGSRIMSLTWLPGTHDQGRTDVRDDLGIPTRDLAMDPSQDLMVLFKAGEDAGAGLPMVDEVSGMLELHIRTMSTDEAHPEARVPVLCAPMLYSITSLSVQIVDDVVGMMYCVSVARPRITIWNWKTGRLVVDRASGNLPHDTWDFSFIHSRALFVTTRDGSGSLELFTFTCDHTNSNTRASINADSDPSSPFRPQPEATPFTHVATLHLPLVRDSVFVLSVETHTGPFVATCPLDTPFVSSNEGRIHVVTVQYAHPPVSDGPRTRPSVCVFVHGRTLERYLEMGAQRGLASTAVGVAEVPWSEWGRTGARMLPHLRAFQWLRYVHGQRVVILPPTSNIDDRPPHRRSGRQTTSQKSKSTFRVLDFNVRRAFDDDDDGDPSQVTTTTTLKRVDYPTHLFMPSIFVDIVESGLPYREASRDVRGGYLGAMIDDERLVGLKHPASSSGDMKEIDVFTM
ncbi:hypothetical protein HD554DRAFT_2323027 [Boletus coccyginus]|nr:hypothetical protein HD554DRAFT_2323027 [Boletus coccyginus]